MSQPSPGSAASADLDLHMDVRKTLRGAAVVTRNVRDFALTPVRVETY